MHPDKNASREVQLAIIFYQNRMRNLVAGLDITN